MKLNFKWWRRFRDWMNSPLPSYTCSSCGEEVIVLGPGMPPHKCDPVALTRKVVQDMKKRGEI